MALSYLPCCQPRRPTARAVSSIGPNRTSSDLQFGRSQWQIGHGANSQFGRE